MRIKMKETRRGAEDGFTVREYAAGQEYQLAETPRGQELGEVFVREGWAERLDARTAAKGDKEKPEQDGSRTASRTPPAPPKGG